ncbi:hypothetical protein CLIB1423_13S00166 [[Candida] railenensis]|uniref:Integral membrane protein n=1 Tax=[Candida] railenensis TaxID=45579 RepID=A0A9P0VZB9_9ASCO|nr:hypothetical protein CLIB1423_13S00166 [[Candida] railenensis]
MLLVKIFLILFLNIINVNGRRYPGGGGGGEDDYLSKHQNYYCTHVSSVGDGLNSEAQFNVIVESISMNDSSVPIPDIPIFIFPLAQLKKFDRNFDFSIKYGGYFWMWDSQSSFNVTVKDKFANDDINYYLGSLEASKFNKADESTEVSLKFDVKKSGIYCAVIIPPEAVEELHTKEYAFNSHGYLPYQKYITLRSQLIYCFILTLLIGLMGFTLYQHGKKYGDSAYEGFDSSSVALIPRVFFCFVYLPGYISAVIRYAFNLNANYAQTNLQHKILINILDSVDKLLNVTNSYVIFLLAAGYGSFYSGLGFGYQKPSSSPTSFHTPMPARMWNRGIQFYVLNILSKFLSEVIDNYGDKIHLVVDYFDGVVDGDKHISAYYFVVPIIDFLNITFPLIWVTTSVVYYFRNSKNMGKLSQRETNSNQYIAKITKSYRSSFVPIFIIPFVFGVIYLGIIIKQVNSTGKKFNRPDIFHINPNHDDDRADNNLANNPTYTVLKLWTNYLATVLSMIFTYFFWIKDNVGIKLSSRIGSTEFSQIPMTDFN